MTDDQHGQGTPQGGGRWDPLPQGDYDDGATAFVKLPEGGIDALLSGDSPLAAPGHGYVPPQIAVAPGADDPAAPGTWTAPASGVEWPDPNATPQAPPADDRFTYQPGATQQWTFEEPAAAPAAPGHDVTGQWSIPVAGGDLPDESGEFTTSSLVEQWGGTPPATLPGGAPAPWATEGAGHPWGRPADPDHTGHTGLPDHTDAHPAGAPAAQAPGGTGAQAPGGAAAQEYARDEQYATDDQYATDERFASDERFAPDGQFAAEGQYALNRQYAHDERYGQGLTGREEAGREVGHEEPRRESAGHERAGHEAARRDSAGRDSAGRDSAGRGEPGPADAGHAPAGRADAGPADAAHAHTHVEAGHPGEFAEPAEPGAEPAAVPDVTPDADGHGPAEVPGCPADGPAGHDRPAGPPEAPQGATAPNTADAPVTPPSADAPVTAVPAEPRPPAAAAVAEHTADAPETAVPEAVPDADDTPGSGAEDTGEDTAPRPEAAAAEEHSAPLPPHDDHPLASYVLRVNGVDRPVTDAWIGESLLYVLRERLGLAGAKDGCSQGECGACNVQVDGRLVASCLAPAVTAAGCEVRTVEGLAADGQPSDVQRALARCGAVQCGFCVPGMAMTVHDLLEGNPAPTELETRQALCGNLCRCSGYRGVLQAVQEVVEEREASSHAASSHAAAGDAETDADEVRIPHQAGPGSGGVNPSAFEAPGAFDTPSAAAAGYRDAPEAYGAPDPYGTPPHGTPGPHDPHGPRDQYGPHDPHYGQDGGQA